MKLLLIILICFPAMCYAQTPEAGTKLPIYFSRYNNTLLCTNKADFQKPWNNGVPPTSCTFLRYGARVTSDGSEKNFSVDVLKVLKVSGNDQAAEAWVERAGVQIAPESPMDAFAATCTQDGGGGEYQRVVTDAQGRVYIKRYMLTSECHNGKLMQRTRPLN